MSSPSQTTFPVVEPGSALPESTSVGPADAPASIGPQRTNSLPSMRVSPIPETRQATPDPSVEDTDMFPAGWRIVKSKAKASKERQALARAVSSANRRNPLDEPQAQSQQTVPSSQAHEQELTRGVEAPQDASLNPPIATQVPPANAVPIESGVLTASITSLRGALSGIDSIPRGHVRAAVARALSPAEVNQTCQVVNSLATWWESVARTVFPNTASHIVVGSQNAVRRSQELANMSAVLSTIEQDQKSLKDLVRKMGVQVNEIHSRSAPSYAQPTLASAAKAQPPKAAPSNSKSKARARSATPMAVDEDDVSNIASPAITAQASKSQDKEVRFTTPAKSAPTGPASKKRPVPTTGFLASIQAKQDAKRNTPSASNPSSSTKRPRSPVSEAASRPQTPSTAPPMAKKVKTDFSIDDLKALQAGFDILGDAAAAAIPESHRIDTILLAGQRALAASQSGSSTNVKLNPSSTPRTSQVPPANAVGAGQGGKEKKDNEFSTVKGKGDKPKPDHSHVGQLPDGKTTIVVAFQTAILAVQRKPHKELSSVMTGLYSKWRATKGLPPVIIVLTKSYWLGEDKGYELRLTFSRRVEDEFLQWMHEGPWNVEKGMDDIQEASLNASAVRESEFVQRLPYLTHIDVMEIDSDELFGDRTDVLFVPIERVWHYVRLLQLRIVGVPAICADRVRVMKKTGEKAKNPQADSSKYTMSEVFDDFKHGPDGQLAFNHPLYPIIPPHHSPAVHWGDFNKDSHSHGVLNCFAYDPDDRAHLFWKNRPVYIFGTKCQVQLIVSSKFRLAQCSHCHRTGHPTSGCKSRKDGWCSKCPGAHTTDLHDLKSVCCYVDRTKPGFERCPPHHWLCCNCGQPGHHAHDILKCKALKKSLDKKWLERNSLINAAISASIGRAKMDALDKTARVAWSKGEYAKAERATRYWVTLDARPANDRTDPKGKGKARATEPSARSRTTTPEPEDSSRHPGESFLSHLDTVIEVEEEGEITDTDAEGEPEDQMDDQNDNAPPME